MARIVSDPSGTVVYPGHLVDLSQQDGNGNFLRSIIKVSNPEKYGIRVSDYFV